MAHSIEREVEFVNELKDLLDKYDIGAESGTPSHYLATYLTNALRNYNETVGHRSAHRGESLELPSLAELTKPPSYPRKDDMTMGGWIPDPSTRF